MSISLQLVSLDRLALRRAHVRLGLETACLAIALIPLLGCGRHAPPATVEGTLRLNGKPLDNCLITFLPEPGQGAKTPHSAGVTDPQGAYRLRFDNQQEGAAVGRHRLTVQDLSASTGVVRRDHGTVDADVKEDAPPPPVRRSRVPEQYMSPRDTPLRKEVKAGDQVIEVDISVKGS
jgi:hypothetical protein